MCLVAALRITDLLECADSIDDQLDGRLRFYEDDLRKRRIDEERIARERDLLNNSLRGSAKLRALERSAKAKVNVDANATGLVNVAFDDVAEAHDNSNNLLRERSSQRQASKAAMQPQPQTETTDGFEPAAIDNLLAEIQKQLGVGVDSDPSLQQELDTVQQLLRSSSTKRLLATCDLLSNAKRRVDLTYPVCSNATTLGDELAEFLAALTVNRSVTQPSRQQASELVELIGSPVFTSLLQAHDKLAGLRNANGNSFGFAFLTQTQTAERKSDLPPLAPSVQVQTPPTSTAVSNNNSLLASPVRSAKSSEGVHNKAFESDHQVPDDSAADSSDVRVVKLQRDSDEPFVSIFSLFLPITYFCFFSCKRLRNVMETQSCFAANSY